MDPLNTPARIARMLGWPEAQRAPAVATRPGSTPRLRVFRSAGNSWWLWALSEGDPGVGGFAKDYGHATTWAEALAVGLAALETATMRSRT